MKEPQKSKKQKNEEEDDCGFEELYDTSSFFELT